MEAFDYEAFRDTLVDALASYELQTTVDEAVFLTSHSRGCEIYVHRYNEPKEVWAKLGFEWSAANQIAFESLKEGASFPFDSVDAELGLEVVLHASFHLHFGLLAISPDVMRSVAEDIQRVGQSFFGDDGGVVAEVSMSTSYARLECLRYEVSTSAPLLSDDPWWDELAEVFLSLLDRLQEIFERLNYEYGSPRDAN